MQKNYQMKVRTGDIVLMPGNVVGIVNRWDIICGGNCLAVRVHPFTSWLHRLFLIFTQRIYFYDEGINKLKVLHQAKEVNL